MANAAIRGQENNRLSHSKYAESVQRVVIEEDYGRHNRDAPVDGNSDKPPGRPSNRTRTRFREAEPPAGPTSSR